MEKPCPPEFGATTGGSIVVTIGYFVLGSFIGKTEGEILGENIGNLFEEKEIYWEHDKNTR